MKEEFKKYFWDVIKNHYADFKGRATRKEYWSFVAAYLITSIILIFLSVLFFEIGLGILGGILIGLFMLFVLVILVPGLALAVRRIHDIGLSGWWYLIGLIPYVGGIVLLVFYCLPSEKVENKWGPNPYNK